MQNMKTLLILRHAKSSWKDMSLSDHDRPLNKRGKRDAPRIGQWMRKQNLRPDSIISSTAKRARKTALAVADETGFSRDDVLLTRDLYHAYPDTYIEFLQKLPDNHQIALVVGHNPGIEELVAHFAGGYEQMQTGALAHVVIDIDRWSELKSDERGVLKGVMRPKEIPF